MKVVSGDAEVVMPGVARPKESRVEGKGNESGAGRSVGRVALMVTVPGWPPRRPPGSLRCA